MNSLYYWENIYSNNTPKIEYIKSNAVIPCQQDAMDIQNADRRKNVPSKAKQTVMCKNGGVCGRALFACGQLNRLCDVISVELLAP